MRENESPPESYRRKVAWQRTPTDNIRLFCQLQNQAFKTLAASPSAMKHFVARNHHKRRRSEVEKIFRSHGKADD